MGILKKMIKNEDMGGVPATAVGNGAVADTTDDKPVGVNRKRKKKPLLIRRDRSK